MNPAQMLLQLIHKLYTAIVTGDNTAQTAVTAQLKSLPCITDAMISSHLEIAHTRYNSIVARDKKLRAQLTPFFWAKRIVDQINNLKPDMAMYAVAIRLLGDVLKVRKVNPPHVQHLQVKAVVKTASVPAPVSVCKIDFTRRERVPNHKPRNERVFSGLESLRDAATLINRRLGARKAAATRLAKKAAAEPVAIAA